MSDPHDCSLDLSLEDRSGEVWRVIPGYSKYEASDQGRFRIPGKQVMKQQSDKDGYLQVGLTGDDGRRKTWKSHRLVATTFLPNPTNLPEVHHVHEVKTDNRASQIQWISRGDNVRASAHQTQKTYLMVDPAGNLVKFKGLNNFCKEHRLPAADVIAVDKGKLYECKGWRNPFVPQKTPKPPERNTWLRRNVNDGTQRQRVRSLFSRSRRVDIWSRDQGTG